MKVRFALTLLGASAALLNAGFPRPSEIRTNQPIRFQALGDLDGGTFESFPSGISADGSVVVGYSNSHLGMEAFRWTFQEGMAGLGFPEAFAVSADGRVVVGYCHAARRTEPIRWTSHGGRQSLGNIAGHEFGQATGAAANGSIIVGTFELPNTDESAAFICKQGCTPESFATMSGAVLRTEAQAVSADGNVVAGAIQYKAGHSVAFRWSSKDGVLALGVLPGGISSTAYAVSADGSVVVGTSETGIGREAFRWTREAGMIGLGPLSGERCNSSAFSVSADGSIIVGQFESQSGPEAFVWDPVHGMRSVRQLLIHELNSDADLHRWKLRMATAVSQDGTSIVGIGINAEGHREAWLARLRPQVFVRSFAFADRLDSY